ncbi:MAG: HAD family phosphatase [Bacteriovoracaceae bacterium]|nr:HAD family phosphatase [Bacteriovoracaceae bacterium]
MIDISKIENIIFDLGVVIINLDFSRTIKAFEQKIPNLDKRTFLGSENQDPFFSQYEVGKISTEDFYKAFLNKFKTKMSLIEFTECWNAMILDIPRARIELLERLKKSGKRIFLLSNINALHEDAVEKSFQMLKMKGSFRSLFNNAYYSHHIGHRKPSPESYEHVIKENKLDKTKTLFIDDMFPNIVAARKVGLSAFHLEKDSKIEKLDIFNNE